MNEYVGVDPGKNGGIARLDEAGAILLLAKMPESVADLLEALRGYSEPVAGVFALLESVHAMPGQGVSSTFSFGENFGLCKGCLSGAGVPWELVRSVEWQRGLGIPKVKDEGKTDRKRRLKAHAQQLWPDDAKIITGATADALLIAEYCRRKRKGML